MTTNTPTPTTEILTKDEAIKAMLEGKTVRHEYFTDNEWMKMNGHYEFEFEDGNKCSCDEFWIGRTGQRWFTGWSIVETTPTTKEEQVLPEQITWTNSNNNEFIDIDGDFRIASIDINETILIEQDVTKEQMIAIAAELTHRYNTFPALLEALKKCHYQLQTYIESELWEMEDEAAYESGTAALLTAAQRNK